jgi:hypothetical protein
MKYIKIELIDLMIRNKKLVFIKKIKEKMKDYNKILIMATLIIIAILFIKVNIISR